jgi:hypothetical protein
MAHSGHSKHTPFVRFWTKADKGGFWAAMVCPLMTQSGHQGHTTTLCRAACTAHEMFWFYDLFLSGGGYASAFLFRRPECRPHPSHPVDGHRTTQWLDCNHKCIWEVLMLTSFNRWQQIGIIVSAFWFIGFAVYFVEYRLTTDMKSNLHEARDSCDKALQSNNDVAILIERKEDRVAQQAQNRAKWRICRDNVREQRHLTVRSNYKRLAYMFAANLGMITFGWLAVRFGIVIIRWIMRWFA